MSSSGSTNKSGAAVVKEEEDATQPRLEESPSVPSVSQSNQSSTDKTNQNTSLHGASIRLSNLCTSEAVREQLADGVQHIYSTNST